ncbi:hypothetical protein K1719_007725 [Acacia pycnantha]|nr:hypothetical protein K1719_007725 [Acacia pycnantha]
MAKEGGGFIVLGNVNGNTLTKENKGGGQHSQEFVPESNLALHKCKEVDMVGKENLHPGEHVNGLKTSNDMDIGHAHVDEDEEDPIESMIIVWNSRGAASKGVGAVIRDMKCRYKLDVLVILEPRVSGIPASKIIKGWGFKYSVRREAVGFVGGIWIVWNNDDLVVDIKMSDEQLLHCNLSLEWEEMLFTTVYANPNEQR